jgi:hypothetical protein
VQHVVNTSCQLARWEVEKTPGVGIAAVIRSATLALADPI